MSSRVQKEVRQEIMATDIYIGIDDTQRARVVKEKDLEHCFTLFRQFERRYSRFRSGNELDLLNTNPATHCTVSEELMEILLLAQAYFYRTQGIFDISTLPLLENEGYTKSMLEGFTHQHAPRTKTLPVIGMNHIWLDKATREVIRPFGLRIDLGGIGKSFIVDRVVTFLRTQQYRDFIVDAGGDLFVAGGDCERQYPWWAIDVETPHHPVGGDVPTLLLSDVGVATSGTNRRYWMKDGVRKHHLIDTRIGKSASSAYQSVTVVAPTVVEADIWAKTLLILGCPDGFQTAVTLSIPALFMDESGQMTMTPALDQYLWKSSRSDQA